MFLPNAWLTIAHRPSKLFRMSVGKRVDEYPNRGGKAKHVSPQWTCRRCFFLARSAHTSSMQRDSPGEGESRFRRPTSIRSTASIERFAPAIAKIPTEARPLTRRRRRVRNDGSAMVCLAVFERFLSQWFFGPSLARTMDSVVAVASDKTCLSKRLPGGRRPRQSCRFPIVV